MVKYERELTNCSLSLISHPSSVRPNEAPAKGHSQRIFRYSKRSYGFDQLRTMVILINVNLQIPILAKFFLV